MTKCTCLILFLVLNALQCFSQNNSENKSKPAQIQATSQSDMSLEMGQKYLKLGFSWVGSENYELAEEYLSKGIKLVKKNGNKYWEGVGYEFYGYLYLNQNDFTTALNFFKRAKELYDSYGKLKNNTGSNEALSRLINNLENGNYTKPKEIVRNKLAEPNNNFESLLEKYKKLELENKQLTDENKNLKDMRNVLVKENTSLKKDVTELKQKNIILQNENDDLLKGSKSNLSKNGDLKSKNNIADQGNFQNNNNTPDNSIKNKSLNNQQVKNTDKNNGGKSNCPWKAISDDSDGESQNSEPQNSSLNNNQLL